MRCRRVPCLAPQKTQSRCEQTMFLFYLADPGVPDMFCVQQFRCSVNHWNILKRKTKTKFFLEWHWYLAGHIYFILLNFLTCRLSAHPWNSSNRSIDWPYWNGGFPPPTRLTDLTTSFHPLRAASLSKLSEEVVLLLAGASLTKTNLCKQLAETPSSKAV